MNPPSQAKDLPYTVVPTTVSIRINKCQLALTLCLGDTSQILRQDTIHNRVREGGNGIERNIRTTAIRAAIDEVLIAFSGVLALYAKNLITREAVCHRADAEMPAATASKVRIMAELYRRFAADSV